MALPDKKPGMDISIALGKPKGIPGAPGGGMDEPMPDQPDADDDAGRLARIESKLDQIMDALGLTGEQSAEPSDEGMGHGAEEMPDAGGYDR